MPRSIKVAIDATGHVHPLESSSSLPCSDEPAKIPEGRAILTWPSPAEESTLTLSEPSLAEDWLRPEEDAAWAHLQPDR